MDVHCSPELRQQSDLSRLLEHASHLLGEILGPQSSQVKAEWEQVQDHRGRPLYRLAIRDLTGDVSTEFDRDELKNSLHLRWRLYRLWGDLLQVRNNQQHQQVQILSSQITTG